MIRFSFSLIGFSILLILSPLCASELLWKDLPRLPDAHGFGGPIVGTHEGALIVAGGANFPNGPPWPVGDASAGSKVWHDRIFVLESEARNWIEAGSLPHSLAYAPAISTKEGVYVLGGETFDQINHPTAQVLLLQWDAVLKKVRVVTDALQDLPKPCQYHGAALIEDTIFVTASHAKSRSSQKLDQKSFWSIDLSDRASARRWAELPTWPGAPREKMAIAVQESGMGKQPETECLYMFSGASWFKNRNGQIDLAKFDFFTDAYRYNPQTNAWLRLADLPAVPEKRKLNLSGYTFEQARGVWKTLPKGQPKSKVDLAKLFDHQRRPAGAAVAIGDMHSRVLLFSGDTGRFITLGIDQRPLFPGEVLSYETRNDQWSVVGRMPIGVVTTGITRWKDKIVIPSGEIRPGVRTNRVQAFRPAPEESRIQFK